MTVTVIGLGPMGQALTTALLDHGHDVTVWNRTKERASGVLERGATWAATPAEAVRSTDLTLINVIDNAAVDAIVEQAGAVVAGRLIVGLASDTPASARRTAEAVASLGGRYLDGAIMTPVATIGTPAASILFAGERDHYDTNRATFEALGATTWLGESAALAAGYDMALLDLFWTATAGFLHAAELAQHAGVEPKDLLPHALGIVGILPAIFSDFAGRIGEGRHQEPTSSLTSIANSVRHLVSASEAARLDPAALTAFGRHVDRAIAAGHGDHEASVVTQRG